MVRTVDYDKRKKEVLGATVDFYVRNASAVSSEAVASILSYSSATIRNIMADLEGLGLLTHTYTSSGRMPTDRGYRFYVDNLLLEIELLWAEKARVIREYKNSRRELNLLLEKTSEILSSLTHYTGITSFVSSSEDKMFYRGMVRVLEQPEFQDLKSIKSLIALLEEKRKLLEIINQDIEENIKVYIGREIPAEDMDNCSLVVSSYKINHKPRGRLAVLGPTRMEYAKVIPVIEYISEILSDVLSEM
ncbi:MAG: HrcA family transcriptional regulator [Candidatus Omnitrophota bacterium]